MTGRRRGQGRSSKHELRLQQSLERLADRGVSTVRATGSDFVVLAWKELP